MASSYEPEKLKEDAMMKSLILEASVNSQVALQILMDKGIATREEIVQWKDKIKSSSKYKASYDFIDQQIAMADLYEKDPNAYLKMLMEAKLRGGK